MHSVSTCLNPLAERPSAHERAPRQSRPVLALATALALLAGCGGGGGDTGDPIVSLTCQPNSRKAALRDYVNDWYFW